MSVADDQAVPTPDERYSKETLAKLGDANLVERLVKNITRDLAISYNQGVLTFMAKQMAAKDPNFLALLSQFNAGWIGQIGKLATEKSKSIAHAAEIADGLPEDLKIKVARDYVTAHRKSAEAISATFLQAVVAAS